MKKLIFIIILFYIASEVNIYGKTVESQYPNNLDQNTTLIEKKVVLGQHKNTNPPHNNELGYQISSALPTVERIKQDLVGHSLAEGLTNGYHPDDWVWLIEDNQIQDFEIINIIEKNDTSYVFIAEMILSNKYYSYNVKAKIKYTSTPYHSWDIDYILSLGMNVIVTHEYDMCIKTSIVDDGWGGTYCVQFNNISEMTLAVGGDYLSQNGWQRFSTIITPHSYSTVGGLFSGGSVIDYRINFIVRIN